MLEQATRCRILATPVTGLDHIDLDACAARGVRVVSLRGEVEFLEQVRGTAELTVALALALLRNIPQAANDVRAGGWNRDRFRGRELFDHTVGIVGLGRLGRLVAGYLRGFGMHVIGYDPRADFPHDLATRVESLAGLAAQADLVSLHVTYDATTRHLVDSDVLHAMKPGAFLINTSRGGVLDEQALLDALRSGRLAGAALDVLDGEPFITAAHPLVAYAREHDNLLIVPHIGGSTVESFAKTEVFLAGKVVMALKSGGC
jgi:D-3-phosphoglycerate dehydrogenase